VKTQSQGHKQNQDPRLESQKAYQSRRLDLIAARWDAKAAAWDQELEKPGCHLNEDEAYSRYVEEVQFLISKRRDFCSRHGVIDAACGTGLILSQVISFFAWGIGVDISSQMIARANAKNIAKANFIIGDCFELASLCRPAGVVLSRGVLVSHYGSVVAEELLRATYNALVPGGFAIFDFLNEAGRAKTIHAPETKEYFTRAAAEALARRAEFEGVTIVGHEDRRVLLMVGEKR